MKKFSRNQIYNELLKSSLKELAKKYDVNYSKFSAFCHQDNIPIPNSKYRTYLRMNRDVSQLIAPLPPAKNDIIYFQSNDDMGDWLKGLDEEKIEQIQQVINEFKYPTNKRLSAKVKNYKNSVKEWQHNNQRNSYSYYSDEKEPKFIENISTKELPRLYRLLDALEMIFNQLGETVQDDFTIIIGEKDKISYDILEDRDKVAHKLTKSEQKELDEYNEELKENSEYVFKPRIQKYDHPFNGKFRIRFEAFQFHTYVKDTNEGKVEDKISQIVIAFYRTYIHERDERLKWEEIRRKKEEAKERKLNQAKRINNEKEKV